MTTKQSIEYGENLLSSQRDTLERIEYLRENKDDKATLEFLLEYLRLDISGKISDAERKLVELRKKYEVEFERDSYVANSSIDSLIEEISKWIGKEPWTVTERIASVVASYKEEAGKMTQEQRNEVYKELHSHYLFLTKTYNDKG